MNFHKPTGIIPCDTRMHGSVFLRVKGIIDTSDDFEMWSHGVKYENIIVQKVLWGEMFELFSGPKILDICDPDWLDARRAFAYVANLADAVTCSSNSLTEYIKQMFPNKHVVHVPDRLNFSVFPAARAAHTGQAQKVAWFGYVHNAHETLKSMLPVIREKELELTIIADREYEYIEHLKDIKTNFVQFSYDTAYSHLKEFDIILNPKSNHPAFRYKSNNKTITGWKLGVPVAETVEQLLQFLEPDARNLEIAKKMPIVESDYNIKQSATQYKEIIDLINGRTNQT